ncbi:amidohydrolase family protein [Demequina salsinemoris]|uniref:amidohydrolase family protein n=1 Tax=Demequina salsinemoris TaxID=577470 RepID=UPI000781F84D|nr:amidohydrolase family protein [Demequina salsinemoris]
MIIDIHGHYTTAPAPHTEWREAQLKAWEAGTATPLYPRISDDDIRETLEKNQLRLIAERGADMTIFSPRASAMGHHLGDITTSAAWAAACNDLIARAVALYPHTFVGVAQLPQQAGVGLEEAIRELDRVVSMGFVGVNVNPDPSGGHWTSPPLTDRYWYPLWERMVEHDVPGMVHVSASANPAFHATGAHYMNADTTAFMQLLQGDLFADFPSLRLIIPHGGGAVPYHWGRYRGLSDMLGKPGHAERLMSNVFLDTCVYHQPGIDLLMDVMPKESILFGSEMVGAVRGIDPTTGHYFDDTLRYVMAADLTDGERDGILSGNALRVYPRLASRLAARAA